MAAVCRCCSSSIAGCVCEIMKAIERRFAELEAAAHANEAALLASLEAEEQSAATARQKRAHRGKKKKKAGKAAASGLAALADSQPEEVARTECSDASEQPERVPNGSAAADNGPLREQNSVDASPALPSGAPPTRVRTC